MGRRPSPVTAKDVHVRQRGLTVLLRIQRVWTHILGTTQTDHQPYGQ